MTDLWKLFASFSSVCEVFIPKKLDKWGKRFGFVKFGVVDDVEEMERKLVEVCRGLTNRRSIRLCLEEKRKRRRVGICQIGLTWIER